MAALLTAEGQTPGAYGIEDVAVAHRGRDDLDAGVSHRVVKAQIAHDGDDNRVVAQSAGSTHGQRADREDLIAVDDLPAGIDGQAPVGVAVVGNAQVGPLGHHALGQRLDMRRAHAVVDVQAVRLRTDRGDEGTGTPVRLGRHGRRRSVGAVDDDAQAVQPGRNGGEQMVEVALRRVVGVADPADRGAGRTPDQRPGIDGGLDLGLDVVGQLLPAAGEQLDAVVRHRIVARGKDDPEIGAEVGGQEGDGRSRQHAHTQDVGTRRGKTRDRGRLEHLAARARVTPHHGEWPVRRDRGR